ncbi:hypothetical protein V4B17_05160 [Bartonella sp. B23]
MANSLKTAPAEIDVIKNHAVLVGDPEKYQTVNEVYSLSKNRKGGLLHEEARQTNGIALYEIRKFR